jgi:hypothetical protein
MDSSKTESTKPVEVLVVPSEYSQAVLHLLDQHALEKAERQYQQESMLQTALLLVHTAIGAHRLQHGTDRTRALHWIQRAVELADQVSTPALQVVRRADSDHQNDYDGNIKSEANN